MIARSAPPVLGRRALVAVAAACAVAAGLLAAAPASADPPRVDNPYAGAEVYVNPEWSANAAAVPGGEAVADQPTAVWLDSLATIHDPVGQAGRTMGLRDHLDAALAQDADLVQLVLHNLPGRSCARPAWHGELAADEIGRYRAEYIDPIVEILSDPAYTELRIVAVVEPDSLANLVLHTGDRAEATPLCNQVLANGAYVRGVGYALARLGELPNVYSYLDASHHGRVGWDEEFTPFTQLLWETAHEEGATPADVHGFAVNTADYGVLREEHLSIDDVINGDPVWESRWVDFNDYVDELPFAHALRERLVSLGFDRDVGVVIDTSRNGWGGPDRPAAPPTTTEPWWHVNDYVDTYRIDRRHSVEHWCNQAAAGLGERPTAGPAPGIDAYAWIKPPGESDGSAQELPSPERRQEDAMCDLYDDWDLAETGALQGGGLFGEWFPEHFARLLANAHPPL